MKQQNPFWRRDSIIRGAVRDKEIARHVHKRRTAQMFGMMANGEWVENGCSKCGGGMSKRIYDFQKENRPKGTICSKCSRKEDGMQ